MWIDIDESDVKALRVTCKHEDKWRLDALPAKAWHTAAKAWAVPIIQSNIDALRANFRSSEFSPPAITRLKSVVAAAKVETTFPGLAPEVLMAHQRSALNKSFSRDHYFFAHAMGTGKSLTIITLANYLHQDHGLSGLLIICPASIKNDVWEKEIEKWLPGLGAAYSYHILVAGQHAKALRWMQRQESSPDLKILVAGIQALSNKQQAAYTICQRFLTAFDSGVMVDESSLIKNHQAGRTRNIIELGKLARWRWCGTGTKITQGIHDLYAQFRYLDWQILGHKSFHTFKNRYCIMGGFEERQIVSYKNVDELMRLIGPHIDVVRKEDANELPPKTYQTRTVKASDLQARIFKELKTYMEADTGDGQLSVQTALERMIRYQQLAGGHVPYQGDDGTWAVKPLPVNPKLDELEAVLQEVEGKVIIWAVFVPEIRLITARLKSVYGDNAVVAYYGEISRDQRADAIERFQHDPACRFFVANQATAGMGITLTAATTAIYYSNSFSHEDRVQSEDRNHRTGQHHKVTYVDLFIDLPIDATIRAALNKKQSVSSYVAAALRDGKQQHLDI